MTLQEAQQVRGLTEAQKKLLQDIETAAKRFNREPKDFKATSVTELKDELNAIIEKKKTKHSKQREKQDAKKQCIELEKENKQNKLQKLIADSGLTQQELIEYLNNN